MPRAGGRIDDPRQMWIADARAGKVKLFGDCEHQEGILRLIASAQKSGSSLCGGRSRLQGRHAPRRFTHVPHRPQ